MDKPNNNDLSSILCFIKSILDNDYNLLECDDNVFIMDKKDNNKNIAIFIKKGRQPVIHLNDEKNNIYMDVDKRYYMNPFLVCLMLACKRDIDSLITWKRLKEYKQLIELYFNLKLYLQKRSKNDYYRHLKRYTYAAYNSIKNDFKNNENRLVINNNTIRFYPHTKYFNGWNIEKVYISSRKLLQSLLSN